MNKVHRWGIIIAFAVIIICAWIGIRAVFVEDKNSTVPLVVGMPLVDAVDALQKQGLLAKVDKVDSPETADTVISQNLPEGEKISSGKVILLKVSKGGSVLPIPDVRGMKFEEGIKRLSESGFKVSKIVRVTDKLKPAGSIIAQNPSAPQTVPANTMLSILVSTGATGGSSFVPVPDLSGETPETAVQILEQAGFTLGSSADTPSNAVPAGTVVSTRPRKGANVPVGTSVNLTIARTPNAGEPAADAPPANDNDKERAEAVRRVVIKESEPVKIPVKTAPKSADKKAAQPNKETKAEQTHKTETVKTETAKTEEPQKPAKAEPTGPKKTAKIRYQVPPLTRPLSVKIELADQSGKRVLKEIMAKGGEYLSINEPYYGSATVSIFLGGDFVWQDRYN